jgi:tRNA threonylcarbamoyladenosine biosynthesis protein TsaB
VTVLGFDTSTAATSACVLRDDGEAFELVPDTEALFRPPAHATELLPAVAQAMERAGADWSEIESIAVGVGPGTFTGLRIGVATARALATARGVPLRPVSSLAALAAGIDAPAALPLIDAKRGEVFGALHRDGAVAVAPFVARPERVPELVGDTRETVLAAGDGSIRFRLVLEAAGVRVAPDGSGVHVVRALHVCRLAAGVPATPPQAVVPTYLREPDAQPQ